MSSQSSEERISQKLSVGEQKSKKNLMAIIIFAIIAIIILVVLILVLTRQLKANRRNVVVTPDNLEEILSDTQNQAKAGTYEVTMNTTWHFDKGDSASSDAYVENSTANTNSVYFDIVLTDTDETIFTSPTLPVGSHLENITLDKALDKGKHACVLTYHLLDDNGNAISKLNLKLTINVNQ